METFRGRERGLPGLKVELGLDFKHAVLGGEQKLKKETILEMTGMPSV